MSGSSRIGTPYLVRSIEPNPIASHDWHVQPVCQRSFRVARLSESLLDRGPGSRRDCPRTWCAGRIYSASSAPPAFLREPFKNIELQHLCQAEDRDSIGFALRELSNNTGTPPSATARIRRSELAGAFHSRVLQWFLFSVGFPTGVRNVLVGPSEPASRFPRWAGQSATGRLHCSIRSSKE